MSESQTGGLKTKIWWALQKFGSLRMKDPIDLHAGSKKKREFVCECGKTSIVEVNLVTSGNTRSCGRCNEMPAEWWDGRKFGKLRLKHPKNLRTGSGRKEVFVCDCGKEKSIRIGDVVSGNVTSCNKCNEMPAEWWDGRKFGKLRLKHPKVLHLRSCRREVFVCNCGTEGPHVVGDVTNGKAQSCGSCAKTVSRWFLENRDAIRVLQAPVDPVRFPSGGLVPLETIKKSVQPFRALCPLCGKEFKPNLNRIKAGFSLTCGCSVNMISRPSIEIFEFIQSIGFEAELEYKLCGYKYDVYVPRSKVLIEFNGTRFHSGDGQKRRDLKKKALAEVYGFVFMSIEERSWRKNKSRVKEEISSVIRSRKRQSDGVRTKNEVLSAVREIDHILSLNGLAEEVKDCLNGRRESLIREMKQAFEDVISAAISSHHVMCEVKNMGPNEAFGNNPFVYYGLGLAGEAGELTGALLRAIRNGGSDADMKAAVESELADCLIYAVILAYSTGIDLVKLVNEKAKIVESRARAGYYGGPIR